MIRLDMGWVEGKDRYPAATTMFPPITGTHFKAICFFVNLSKNWATCLEIELIQEGGSSMISAAILGKDHRGDQHLKIDIYYYTVRSLTIGTSTYFSSFWLYTSPQWI